MVVVLRENELFFMIAVVKRWLVGTDPDTQNTGRVFLQNSTYSLSSLCLYVCFDVDLSSVHPVTNHGRQRLSSYNFNRKKK